MQVQLFNRRLKGGEQTDRETDAPRRLQDIDPATHPLNGPGKVRRAAFQKTGPLGLAHDFPRPLEQDLCRDGFADRSQRAANAHRRSQSGLQMEVAGALLSRCADERFQVHGLAGFGFQTPAIVETAISPSSSARKSRKSRPHFEQPGGYGGYLFSNSRARRMLRPRNLRRPRPSRFPGSVAQISNLPYRR